MTLDSGKDWALSDKQLSSFCEKSKYNSQAKGAMYNLKVKDSIVQDGRLRCMNGDLYFKSQDEELRLVPKKTLIECAKKKVMTAQCHCQSEICKTHSLDA